MQPYSSITRYPDIITSKQLFVASLVFVIAVFLALDSTLYLM